MNAYRVVVKTTNGLKDTFQNGENYEDCEGGTIFVVAKNYQAVLVKFAKTEIEEIKLIGKGFYAHGEEKHGD